MFLEHSVNLIIPLMNLCPPLDNVPIEYYNYFCLNVQELTECLTHSECLIHHAYEFSLNNYLRKTPNYLEKYFFRSDVFSSPTFFLFRIQPVGPYLLTLYSNIPILWLENYVSWANEPLHFSFLVSKIVLP